MKVLILILVVLVIISYSKSQEIKWDAELRVRSELDGRDFKNSTPPNYFSLFRARLGAHVQPIENIKIYLQIQDARIFGEEKDATGSFNTISNTKNLDLHQGYMQIDKFVYDEISFKLGRQRLSYGNQRIMGAVMWNNVGRIYDGGLIRYEIPKHRFDLFVMNTAETNVSPSAATPAEVKFVRDAGQLFSGLYYTTKYFTHHQLDLFTLHQLDRNISISGFNDLSRFTSGIYATGAITDELFYEADLAIQNGWKKGSDISAYLLALTGGYNFVDMPISSVSVSFERLSGTPAGDTKYKTFEPPYATGHKFYGFMDYFTNIPKHTGGRGLQDIYARIIFHPYESVTANFTLHNFTLAEKLNPPMSNETELGQEIDFVLNWRYNKHVSFECGGGLFLPGRVMRDKFGGNDIAHWGYITTSFSF